MRRESLNNKGETPAGRQEDKYGRGADEAFEIGGPTGPSHEHLRPIFPIFFNFIFIWG